MTRDRSAEEVKQDHIQAMGKELGGLYLALWNEVAWLHSKWMEYVELFGTKSSRIHLLNKTASHFFRIVQDTLWEDCILQIARLTDPPKSAGKENLTIRKLPILINNDGIKHDVSQLIDIAITNADFCRDWRNRRIAHKDFALAMEAGAEALMPASRATIKQALDSISDVLNSVSSHYTGSTTWFEGIPVSNGALYLLHVLDDGLWAIDERMERVKSGNFDSGVFRNRDI
jgi:hypothetical protein